MKLLKRSKAAEGWLAIDCSQPTVHAVRVERDGDDVPCLTLMATADAPGTDGEVLARLRRAVGKKPHNCTTTIPTSQYQIMQLNAPPVPPSERNSALLWNIKDTLSFHVDDTLVQSMDIPADGSPIGHTRLLLVIAARRSSVVTRTQLIERAGFSLRAIDVAETCQRNISHLFEKPGRATALISFDDRGGLLTFTHRGELYATRRLDTNAADILAGAAGDGLLSQPLYERVALEVQRSLDNFDRLFSLLSVDRLLIAPGPGMDALVSFLRPQILKPVALADLRDVLATADDVSLGNTVDQAPWFAAIGMALRNETSALVPGKVDTKAFS